MLEDNRIILSVEDDGVGMTPEQIEHIFDHNQGDENSSRIGVHNVHERIKIYYGTEFGLKYFSTPDVGTTAMLILPAMYEEVDGNEV